MTWMDPNTDASHKSCSRKAFNGQRAAPKLLERYGNCQAFGEQDSGVPLNSHPKTSREKTIIFGQFILVI